MFIVQYHKDEHVTVLDSANDIDFDRPFILLECPPELEISTPALVIYGSSG